MSFPGHRWKGWGWGLVFWLGLAWGTHGLRLEPSQELLSAEVVATGLLGPAGMAQDPKTGRLYVAERLGQRISLLEDRAARPVLGNDFEVSRKIHGWAFSRERTRDFWTEAVFRSPSSIVFDQEGRLYVAEAGYGGRLFVFDAWTDGVKKCQIISTPWIELSYGYSSLAVDRHGRIYTSAQDVEPDAVLSFGNVLVRELNGDWWIVDYGPFAEFSNVAVDPPGRMLVFGENRGADLSWYDTDRQVEIASMKHLDGLRHVVLLPDGTTLISLQRDDGTWSIAEADPIRQNVFEWVGGLSEIGGLFAHPQSGDLYVSLAREGRIMKFHRLNPLTTPGTDKLGLLTRAFELEKALPPKDWPEFFREFIDKLGVVRTVDQRFVDDTAAKMSLSKVPLTMGEFASVVPVIAAKVKATLISPPELEPDPIVEVSFLLFYPNRSMLTQRTIAPSISLFRALHKSGRVTQTRFMPNKAGMDMEESMDWEHMPEVLVSFPSGYYAPDTGLSEKGLVRVYFLGMGLGSDFWIDVHRINKEKSNMRVEKISGQKIEYRIEPYKTEGMGGEEESVLVAGIKGVETGWFNVGAIPVLWNLINGDPRPFKFKHGLKLADLSAATIPTGLASAPSSSRALSTEEIGMYRRLVLRAATRWSGTHF